MNIKLKTQLIKMMINDQKMRSSGKWDDSVDKKNIIKLKKIIAKYGWPDIEMVGEEASSGAWVIAQHADNDLKFQKLCLELITDKFSEKKIPSWQIAYLTDRIKTNSNLPQIYGTQFYLTKNKRFTNRPIKNKSTLDKRRKEIGLEPFKTYKNKLLKSQKNLQKK